MRHGRFCIKVTRREGTSRVIGGVMDEFASNAGWTQMYFLHPSIMKNSCQMAVAQHGCKFSFIKMHQGFTHATGEFWRTILEKVLLNQKVASFTKTYNNQGFQHFMFLESFRQETINPRQVQ